MAKDIISPEPSNETKLDNLLENLDQPTGQTSEPPATPPGSATPVPGTDGTTPKPAVTPTEKEKEVTPPAAPVPVTPAGETPKEPETPTSTATPASTPKETLTPTPTEKLYAGRYADKYNLMIGTMEINKAVGGDNKTLVELFKAAEESGDWSPVEAKYKELQAEHTKKSQEAKVADTPADTSEESVSTEVIPPQWKDQIDNEALQRFNQTEVGKTMAALGYAIPTSDPEVNALFATNYSLAKDFVKTFQQIYDNVKKDARVIIKAQKEAPVHNNQQVELAKQQINELIKKWNAEFPQEDIDKAIAQYVKDPSIYESRNSQQYIRTGEILRRFVGDNGDKLHEIAIAKAKAEASNKASVDTAETLANLKEKTVKSIGSTVVPAQGTRPVKIDLTDEKQVRSLSSEDAERAFQEELEKL
jgi:hypothetical protein